MKNKSTQKVIILQPKEELTERFELYRGPIAGLMYYIGHSKCILGAYLQMVHERSNRFDSCAIKLTVGSFPPHIVGYVPRNLAHDLHLARSLGWTGFKCRIVHINRRTVSWSYIIISITANSPVKDERKFL